MPVRRLVRGLVVLMVALGLPVVAASSAGAAAGDPMLSITTPTVEEGAAGTTTVVELTFTQSEALATSFEWRWTTFYQPDYVDEELPATPGEDYVDTGGVITFGPGETVKHATITVIGDDKDEPNEFIAYVALKNIEPFDFGTLSAGPVHIVDDDDTALVLPGEAQVTETDAAGLVLHLPVTLSAPSGYLVTVSWKTIQVGPLLVPQAKPGKDYTASSGSVVFNPGVTSRTVDIPITGDGVHEHDEIFIVSFYGPSGAEMGGYWGLGFAGIADDD